MAEETFDPTTMPETSRYHLKYPGATDLVRFASQQFQTMCEAIDNALGDVDDRHTTAARSTIVMNTLAALKTADAAQGQFGYVYNDPDTNLRGVYIYNSAWIKVTGELPLTIVRDTLSELNQATAGVGTFGLVQSDPDSGNDGVYVMDSNGWSALSGGSGQTVVKDTLAQLAATGATTGQLATVTNDTKKTNNGLYLMTGGTWNKVGGKDPTMLALTATFTTTFTTDYASVDAGSSTSRQFCYLASPSVTARYASGDYADDGNIVTTATVTIPGARGPVTGMALKLKPGVHRVSVNTNASATYPPALGFVLYSIVESDAPYIYDKDSRCLTVFSEASVMIGGFTEAHSNSSTGPGGDWASGRTKNVYVLVESVFLEKAS